MLYPRGLARWISVCAEYDAIYRVSAGNFPPFLVFDVFDFR